MAELVAELVLDLVVEFAAELISKPVALEPKLAFESVES